MANPVRFSVIKATADAWNKALKDGYTAGERKVGGSSGAPAALAEITRALGFHNKSASTQTAHRLNIAVALGLQVDQWPAVSEDFTNRAVMRYRAYDPEYQDAKSRRSRPAAARPEAPRVGGNPGSPSPSADGQPSGRGPTPTVVEPGVELLGVIDKIVPLLRRGPLSTEEIAVKLDVLDMTAWTAVYLAHSRGASITERDGKWYLDAAPATGSQLEHKFELVTDSNGYLEFGACGDQHLCSKYERLDCLNDYYDHVEHRGIKTVLSAGNHVDGESSFNRHDIFVHGLDPQLQYLAKNYPQRAGVETWAISGEDHEGWWSRREGVDIGRYAENVMHQNGRSDWRNLGFMECFIPIIHGDTGKTAQLCLMHPGGGSAYAISYAPQKIVEGFDGGAKPSVLLIGHYHKSSYQMTRNVHTLQTGCFQDQSLFMRQKKLAAHLGGWFVKVHICPETGAVDEFTCTFRNYFVKDFYAGRWSEHGPVNHVKRSAIP